MTSAMDNPSPPDTLFLHMAIFPATKFCSFPCFLSLSEGNSPIICPEEVSLIPNPGNALVIMTTITQEVMQ